MKEIIVSNAFCCILVMDMLSLKYVYFPFRLRTWRFFQYPVSYYVFLFLWFWYLHDVFLIQVHFKKNPNYHANWY